MFAKHIYCPFGSSCSSIAMEEHPGLDPLYISAASIARRVQDPLSEYVKIEPKHLGIGMYQHDLPEAKLKKNLDEIMIECVSFAGEYFLYTCTQDNAMNATWCRFFRLSINWKKYF